MFVSLNSRLESNKEEEEGRTLSMTEGSLATAAASSGVLVTQGATPTQSHKTHAQAATPTLNIHPNPQHPR